MPTFTAIALDRLLEPAGASKYSFSSSRPGDLKLEKRNSFSASSAQTTTKAPSSPFNKSGAHNKKPGVPHPKLSRRNSTALATENKKEENQKPSQWPQISPALYATPASTPLPDSPTSFPPSPYIINHKRRGPRLSKSISVEVLSQATKPLTPASAAEPAPGPTLARDEGISHSSGEDKSNGMEFNVPVKSNGLSNDKVAEVKNSSGFVLNGASSAAEEVQKKEFNGFGNGNGIGSGSGNGEIGNGCTNTINEHLRRNSVYSRCNSEREDETEDFYDPQDSLSFTSTTDNNDDFFGSERSARASSTPMGEFYDAWEELSSESGSGRHPQRSVVDLEFELRESRLSLMMEIEKRKQAEETLTFIRSQWQTLSDKLREEGLVLPPEPPVPAENCLGEVDFAIEICRKLAVMRYVSESIGRGAAKAELQAELDIQLEAKNFEIARLSDRLRYYESMNREMTQRNQEAIETARRDRQRRRRRQKWVWGSLAAAMTLGTAAIAWSYLPGGKGSSTSSHEASERDNTAE